jgi:histone arginine demethylase JMJD6
MSQQVERRANLSYDDFVKEYVSINKPVILTDAMNHWKALGRWSPEFFKQEFGNMEIDVNKVAWTERAGVPKPSVCSMAQFVDRVLASSDDNPAPYLRNQNLCDLFPSLLQEVMPLPRYLTPNWLPESFSMKPLQRVFREHAELQFYFGGQGGSFPSLHFDVLASHAFLMEIYGRKRFVIFSPDQQPYLYLQPNSRNHSQVNVENPDLKKFPLFAQAKPIVFVLEPGELLFVPSGWWHTTKMLTPCISISLNVVNSSNWKPLTKWVCDGRKPYLRLPSRIYLSAAGSWRLRRDQKQRLSR